MPTTLKFKRFTRRQVLQRSDRELLSRFFGQFAGQLRSRALSLPTNEMEENIWRAAVANLLHSPEELPEELNEALFAIDELSGPDGQEQLESALARAGRSMEFRPGSSREDLVLQVWLADRTLLTRAHNEQRLRRLSAFECFGASRAATERGPFVLHERELLSQLTAALDPWFALHQRGRDTVRLELYLLDEDYWFLVRHGDTYARAPKVEAQKTEVLHFRPERDDVVVYSPEQDELRINARTRGERDLYVRTFGRCLRGCENYFSQAGTYTLEPLRTEGAEALSAVGLDGINRIVLRALEMAWEEGAREILTHQAEDLFKCAPSPRAEGHLLPRGWRLARAEFDFHFAGQRKPRAVQIRLPNVLKLGRHCDLRLVSLWMSQRGFRVRS